MCVCEITNLSLMLCAFLTIENHKITILDINDNYHFEVYPKTYDAKKEEIFQNERT